MKKPFTANYTNPKLDIETWECPCGATFIGESANDQSQNFIKHHIKHTNKHAICSNIDGCEPNTEYEILGDIKNEFWAFNIKKEGHAFII